MDLHGPSIRHRIERLWLAQAALSPTVSPGRAAGTDTARVEAHQMDGDSGSGSAGDGGDSYLTPCIGLAVAVLAFGCFAAPMKIHVRHSTCK